MAGLSEWSNNRPAPIESEITLSLDVHTIGVLSAEEEGCGMEGAINAMKK